MIEAQLPTNLTLATRLGSQLSLCRFGCPSPEDIHHIFVHCPQFNHLCDEYLRRLLSEAHRILDGSSLPPTLTSHLECVFSHLFSDHSPWPFASSQFYLGLLPPLLPSSLPSLSLSQLSSRTLSRLAQCCHTSAIHLAGRIWGIILRQYLSTTSTHITTTAHCRVATHDLHQSLPSHLCYLTLP